MYPCVVLKSVSSARYRALAVRGAPLLLAAVCFTLGFAPSAQAQTSLLNSFDKVRDGSQRIRSDSATQLLSYTTQSDAIIERVDIHILSTPSNITTLLAASVLRVGGARFSYDSYDSSQNRATFVGSRIVLNNRTESITLQCSGCGGDTFLVSATQSTPDGWPSTASFQFARLQMWGKLPNWPPVLALIGSQAHRANAPLFISPTATDLNNDTLNWFATSLPPGLSINAGTGAITGSPTAAGTYTTTVSVSDSYSADSESFTWTIAANNAPVLAFIGNQTGAIGEAVSLSSVASDIDSDTVSWSATDLPAGLSINSDTGLITGTPTTNNVYSTIISISDGFGGTDSESLIWTISNVAPVLATLGDQSSSVGVTARVTPSAFDANGDSISWSADGLPTGLSINADTGAITGTPSAAGSFSTTVSISDGHAGTDSESFIWTVVEGNSAPVLTPIDDRTSLVSAGTFFAPLANDANGDVLSWSADGLPTGLSLDSATGVITGTPSSTSTYTVTLTVTDPSGADDSESFDWIIALAADLTDSADDTNNGNGGADNGSADNGGANNGGTDNGGADGANEGANEDEAGSVETPPKQFLTLTDVSTKEMIDITLQSVLPVIRMANKKALSRFAELRENPVATRGNQSSHGVRFTFADQAIQQIADSGFGGAVADYANRKTDQLLPDGMAFWSRGQVLIGHLSTATGGDKVKISATDLTLGVDQRLSDAVTIGGFFQASQNETTAVSNLVDTDLEAGTLMLYGSYMPRESFYIQGALGYGSLNTEIDRVKYGDHYTGGRDGDIQHLILSASRQFQMDGFEMGVTVDLDSEIVELKPYTEIGGTAAFHFMNQKVRTLTFGAGLRFSDSYTSENGTLVLFGELSYHGDFSQDTDARGYLLADPNTIYLYHVNSDDEGHSLAHDSLTLGGSFVDNDGWSLEAVVDLETYHEGFISGVTISYLKQF